MKLHYYKTFDANSVFATKEESILYNALPDENMLTEEGIITFYEAARNRKPSDYPSMSRNSIIGHIRLLQEKGFLKGFSGYEIRNALKLSR